MLRFYRDFIGKTLMYLYVLKYILKMDENAVRVHLSTWASTPTPLEVPIDELEAKDNTYNYLQKSGQYSNDTLDQIIATFSKAFAKKSSHKEDVDLIDTIVRILQLNHTTNRFSPENIALLRKALLLPSEMNNFAHKIEANELSCRNCGHKFMAGESVTIYDNDDIGMSIYCINCVAPTTIACCKCKEHTDIPDKLKTGLRSLTCTQHNKKEAPARPVHDEVFRLNVGPPEIAPFPPRGQPAAFIRRNMIIANEMAGQPLAQPRNPFLLGNHGPQVQAPLLPENGRLDQVDLPEFIEEEGVDF